MKVELIIIFVSIVVIFGLYAGRMRASGHGGVFSNSFLSKTDEVIFEFIKFVFKLHALVVSNLGSFFREVPHRFVHGIHSILDALSAKTKQLLDRLKGKSRTK